MGGDRVADETLDPAAAGFLFRDRPELLQQMSVTMCRCDGGFAALRDRVQVRSLEAKMTDDGARFVERDDRHELTRLVQVYDPVRIVQIGSP